LPGGDFPAQGFEALLKDIVRDYPWFGAQQSRRLALAASPEYAGYRQHLLKFLYQIQGVALE